jgi:hypothetical protein
LFARSSHLVTVPPGPLLSDALISSPVIVGEDGAGAITAGFEFGIDPNEDPELALVSLNLICPLQGLNEYSFLNYCFGFT